MPTSANANANASSDVSRRLANFHPCVWGDHFIQYGSESMEVDDKMEKRIQILKEEVRKMLVPVTEKALRPLTIINLIDSLQCLGVHYHFQQEIDQVLECIHNIFVENGIIILSEFEDLRSLALIFRLLRQQGYHVLPGVFEKFRDDKGEFKMSLIGDVLGMLSLFEAAHVAIHGEDILDQALTFTTFHLESRLSDMKPNLKEKVLHALKWPLHRTMPRLTAKCNIPMYSREDSRNDLLLEFAVLDFNTLQALQRKELSHLTEWWKNLESVKKLPYTRDRVVESYIFVLGAQFDEPQYAIGRKLACKLCSEFVLLDDTYDAYATIEELELITEAIQRWDTNSMDSLSGFMKVIVEAMINLLSEMELDTARDGKSCFVQYVKPALQAAAKAYLAEARWRNEGKVPTYDEYKANGMVTAGYRLTLTTNFLGLGKYATKQVFDWISNHDLPKIVKASSLMARLTNDVSSYKFEQERGPVAEAVQCCSKQYGISEEKAHEVILKEIQNYWKDINEECLSLMHNNVVPKPVIEMVLNYTRVLNVMYANMGDGYTHGQLLKDYVTLLLVDPIRI